MQFGNISQLLHDFYMISGLKLNINESHIYGVNVKWSDVQRVSDSNGCSCENLPFTYLGLPIRSSMSRKSTWEHVIEKFKKRLLSWKVKCLSAGGTYFD